jgi:hypothetical protein
MILWRQGLACVVLTMDPVDGSFEDLYFLEIVVGRQFAIAEQCLKSNTLCSL